MEYISADDTPFRVPTDAEISEAERRLGVSFHADYRAFLRGGSDVGDSVLEPAVILPGSGYLDLFGMTDRAWRLAGVPRELFPFVEDNGNYYCLRANGEVVYWSHDGTTEETWVNIAEWRETVCFGGQ